MNTNILNKEIDNIINKNLFSQAYLVVCNDIKLAKKNVDKLAKALICPGNYVEKCNKCNICERIDKNNYPELKIVNPENNVIKKEKIISIKNSFQTNSIEGKNQVYIINEAELLNSSSANSILKFVEEPDSNTVAIFTTTNLNKMIPTIVSRCKILRISENDNDEYHNMLNYCEIEEDEVKKLIKLYKMIEEKNIDLLNYKNSEFQSYFEKEAFKKVLKFGLFFYKDALNYSYNSKFLIFDDINNLKIEKTEILKKINIILENLYKIEYNVNMSLFVINYFIEMGEV